MVVHILALIVRRMLMVIGAYWAYRLIVETILFDIYVKQFPDRYSGVYLISINGFKVKFVESSSIPELESLEGAGFIWTLPVFPDQLIVIEEDD